MQTCNRWRWRTPFVAGMIVLANATTALGNVPPVLGGTPSTQVRAGGAYVFTPAASDRDGDRLTFRLVNRPWWISFDYLSGRLSGTAPVGALPGTVWRDLQLSVSDAVSTRSLPPFSITIQAGLPPSGNVTVTWLPPTRQTDGSPLLSLAGYRLWYGRSAAALDRQVTIANPGATAQVVSGLEAGRWYFAVTAFSTAGQESTRSATATAAL